MEPEEQRRSTAPRYSTTSVGQLLNKQSAHSLAYQENKLDKTVMEISSILDSLTSMNDICKTKTVFEWESITGSEKISNIFGECLNENPQNYYLNQVVFTDKRSKNQFLTILIYKALQPTYADVDGREGQFSTDFKDFPHIELVFVDNCGDFCFDTLKRMIYEDLKENTFKENDKIKDAEIQEFACLILDKVILQPCFTLKELIFALLKTNIYIKRNPIVRLVVIDSLNTFFTQDFNRFAPVVNSQNQMKRKSSMPIMEFMAVREMAKIAISNSVKVLFTTIEYFPKKGLKYEQGTVLIEEPVSKYLSYACNEEMDLGISVLYLVNPVTHPEAVKGFLSSVDYEPENKDQDPDCIVTINKRNDSQDYVVRAIKVERGPNSQGQQEYDLQYTLCKRAHIKGGFGADFGAALDD